MSGAEPSAAQPSGIARWVDYASGALQAAGPPLLFGLRLWASVCLALYVAFWLELDNAFWAGTSAAIVCQPQLGASLRKGWFRMIGTIVGAVAIVVLTACFPQDRVAVSRRPGAVGRRLRFRRHAAAQLRGLRGGARRLYRGDHRQRPARRDRRRERSRPSLLAVTRASEICIGIVCAGVVLAGTDFGGAARRLAALFARSGGRDHRRLHRALGVGRHPNSPTRRPVRRELHPPRHRARPGDRPGARGIVCRSAITRRCCRGRWTACSPRWPAGARWQITCAGCRSTQARQEAAPSCRACRRSCADGAGQATGSLDGRSSRSAPDLRAAARQLIALPAEHAVAAPARRSDGRSARRPVTRAQWPRLAGRRPGRPPCRVAAASSACACPTGCPLWSMPGAPSSRSAPSRCSGSSPLGRTAPAAITFAAIAVILFAPRADQAYAAAHGFTVGTPCRCLRGDRQISRCCRRLETFAGLSLAHRLCPRPARRLLMRADRGRRRCSPRWRSIFMPLLAPDEPDELRHRAILQLGAGDRRRRAARRRSRFACCRRCRRRSARAGCSR